MKSFFEGAKKTLKKISISQQNLFEKINNKEIKPFIKTAEQGQASFTNHELWLNILFYLNANEFWKMGRVSQWFYLNTRDQNTIKNNSPKLWSGLFGNKHELLELIENKDQLKNLVINGNNNILFSFFAKEDNESSKDKISSDMYFNLIKLAIEHKNFKIFKFLTSRIKSIIKNEFFSLWTPYPNPQFSRYFALFPTYFGFHISHLLDYKPSWYSSYDTSHIGYNSMRNNIYHLKNEWESRSSHKEEIFNILINAGAKWIIEIIDILKLLEEFYKKANIVYLIDFDILDKAKQLNKDCYEDLLKSIHGNYLMSLKSGENLAKNAFKNSLTYNISNNPNSNSNAFFNNSNSQSTKIHTNDELTVMKYKINKLKVDLTNALKVVEELEHELETKCGNATTNTF